MSLENWLNNGWLVRHQASRQETIDLLMAADRDIEDCRIPGLSPDWKLNIAHNSVLLAATAALAASGYRASREAHRYLIIQSLVLTIGTDRRTVDELDAFRKKRNLGGYQRAGVVSKREADEMVALAKTIRESVAIWLKENHPELL